MPCIYDPGPEDHLRDERAKNEKMRKDLDHLTHENDQLREALLNLINDRNYVLPEPVVQTVSENQTKHRKEDLKRLKKTFMESEDALRLGLVILADPTKPLEPQLGFNPDEF